MPGSTAVTPAPVLHEYQDGSNAAAAAPRSECVGADAHADGVLAVMPPPDEQCCICDRLQAGAHTAEVLKQLLPNLTQTEVLLSSN